MEIRITREFKNFMKSRPQSIASDRWHHTTNRRFQRTIDSVLGLELNVSRDDLFFGVTLVVIQITGGLVLASTGWTLRNH